MPLKSEMYSNAELKDIICSEGLGYAITAKIAPDVIADVRVSRLWAEAQDVLAAVEEALDMKEMDC